MILKLVALFACVAYASAAISSSCLACICEVESNCRALSCRMDVGSLSCGYYQIKSAYYSDCHSPGSGWQSCSSSKSCADQCVRNYMARYGTYCTGGRTPTCEDYARVHNGGPYGCRHSNTLGYWQKVQACLSRGKK
ncbi:lysozyme-like [Liolophura sinensis]|uniref:lysozyme-like n=1 Tax=Liolophura sinensis TaxID=3198878 RepID=UPI003158A345